MVRRVVVLALLLMLVAVACGDDNVTTTSSPKPTTASTTTTTAPSETTTTTTGVAPEIDGATAYQDSCAVCHGSTGTEGPAPNLVDAGLDETFIRDLIGAGHAGVTLSADELDAVIAYLNGLLGS